MASILGMEVRPFESLVEITPVVTANLLVELGSGNPDFLRAIGNTMITLTSNLLSRAVQGESVINPAMRMAHNTFLTLVGNTLAALGYDPISRIALQTSARTFLDMAVSNVSAANPNLRIKQLFSIIAPALAAGYINSDTQFKPGSVTHHVVGIGLLAGASNWFNKYMRKHLPDLNNF